MFVVCWRQKKAGRALAIAGVVLAAVLGILAVFPGAVTALSMGKQPLVLKDADQNTARVEFLTGLGWQVSEEAVEVKEVVIPLEFDQVYQRYNALQQEQGLDLTLYAGCRAIHYSYEVYNHPAGAEDIRANLLICDGRLVAGDICSLRLDGFMEGLCFPGGQGPSLAQNTAPVV